MQARPAERIILAVDGSAAALTRLLQNVSLSRWREDQLILIAIVPRPAELFSYEPNWFVKTLSPDEFQSLKDRLHQCVKQLVACGFRASLEVIHSDDPRGVKASLMGLNPDLVVMPRRAGARNLLRWFRPLNTSLLIDVLPCPVLVI